MLLAFALPAVAQAHIKVVDMGLPKNEQKPFFGRYQSDVDDFFPHGVTINAGDIVRFVPTGFHTVDIPARGRKPLPLLTPVGKKLAGANDAAGIAFWFNGQPQLGFTPALLKGAFGKHLGYNGSRRIESGLPIQRNPKSFFVRFARPGSYTYYCNIHPGMKGVVRVLPKRRPAPSASQDARALKAQIANDLKVAKALRATKPAAGVVDVGAAGRHGVESFGFFPQTLSVPVGTTLRFTMTKRSFEDYTATTGPGNPGERAEVVPRQARRVVQRRRVRPGRGLPQRPSGAARRAHPDQPRERVLELRRPRQLAGDAVAGKPSGDVRGCRDVPVLLSDPPVHARDRRRAVRAAAVLGHARSRELLPYPAKEVRVLADVAPICPEDIRLA